MGGDQELVRSAIEESAACEFATAAEGRPEAYPVTPFYDYDRDRIVVSSPPAYAGKVVAVRTNPEVTLRCYGHEPTVVVQGRARVRPEGPREAAEYLRSLVADGPDTPKRRAMAEMQEDLESGLSRYLLDWYRLRILVEIEPISAVTAPEAEMATLPGWPAVDMSDDEGRSYERVLLVTADDAAIPTIRPVEECVVVDPVAHLTCGEDSPAVGSRACLLAHWHNRDLSRLGQRLIRGRLVEGDHEVCFRPGSSFSLRNDSVLDALRFVWEGKRRTRAYFDETGPLDWFFRA